MKNSYQKFKGSFLTVAFVITGIMIFSCERKIDTVPKSDLVSLPSLTVNDFRSVLTDSGRIQLVMVSPLLEKYDNTDPPYSEFKSGIKVDFYDGHEKPVASVTAKYGKYNQSDDLWELRDSVIVLNENHDMLETELLFWNRQKDLIYTDRFVKITNVDQIINGFGFESDSHLLVRKIKKVQAIIYLNEEE